MLYYFFFHHSLFFSLYNFFFASILILIICLRGIHLRTQTQLRCRWRQPSNWNDLESHLQAYLWKLTSPLLLNRNPTINRALRQCRDQSRFIIWTGITSLPPSFWKWIKYFFFLFSRTNILKINIFIKLYLKKKFNKSINKNPKW